MRLNPLTIKFDKLNLNNGGILETFHSQDEAPNNRAHLTFITLNSYEISHNFYLIKKNIQRALVRIEGWVTDDEGIKTEFDSLYGVLDLFHYRG